MTLEDFYTALSQTPRRWRLEGGAIRMPLEPSDSPWIDHDLVDSQCPWSYVDMMRHGGTLAQLPFISVFAAADNAEGHDPAIRARLLQACGLAELSSLDQARYLNDGKDFDDGDPGDER